jgi:FKBP-type peptidyl-prolyl cis-trans isomerase SlyD
MNGKVDKVADNIVVSIQYELSVDGEVIDQTEGDEVIEFLQGFGNIIPGLEEVLYGLSIGDNIKVDVSPEDGYGYVDSDDIRNIPRSEFPHEIPLAPGVELELTDNEGDVVYARIVSVGKSDVKLDFNHPLAGKELHFDVTVVDLRAATIEELDHGHVHGEDEE